MIDKRQNGKVTGSAGQTLRHGQILYEGDTAWIPGPSEA